MNNFMPLPNKDSPVQGTEYVDNLECWSKAAVDRINELEAALEEASTMIPNDTITELSFEETLEMVSSELRKVNRSVSWSKFK